MEPDVKETAMQQVQVFDETGRLIGVITRPVVTDVLGPGREKVYLARRRPAAERTPHAA
jgi:hypothetical protein